MNRFFSDIPTKHLLKLSGESFIENGPNNYCNGLWNSISCEGARITRLYFWQLRVGNFRLHEVPPTLEYLWIYECNQAATFHTRNLPRALVSLCVSVNKRCGRLDLMTLPENLENAQFWENRFTGPICLCHLPKSLKNLDVHGNAINQVVVWYDHLPPEIIEIRLQNNGQHKIGKVCALHPGEAVDPTIFAGMRRSAIE